MATSTSTSQITGQRSSSTGNNNISNGQVHEESETPTTVHPEDTELIKNLASLQEMHTQLLSLRTLLPNRLITPTRTAINNPKTMGPRVLAETLSRNAADGAKEIAQFKRQWNDPKMKEVWKESMSVEGKSQVKDGVDAWYVDYRDLRDQAAAATSTGPVAKSDSSVLEPGTAMDIDVDVNGNTGAGSQTLKLETIEEAKTALSKFREENKEAKIESASEDAPFPLVVQAGPLTFRVTRNDTNKSYDVTLDDRSKSWKVAQQILEHVQSSTEQRKKLRSVLVSRSYVLLILLALEKRERKNSNPKSSA